MDQELDQYICRMTKNKLRLLDIADLVKIRGKLLGYTIKTKRERRAGIVSTNIYYVFKNSYKYYRAYFTPEGPNPHILLYTHPHRRRRYYSDGETRSSLYSEVISLIIKTIN